MLLKNMQTDGWSSSSADEKNKKSRDGTADSKSKSLSPERTKTLEQDELSAEIVGIGKKNFILSNKRKQGKIP